MILRKHDGRAHLSLTPDTCEGRSLPVSLYDFFYEHIREKTRDRELSGNANEGEQEIHPTTAMLCVHPARNRPIQTKQDMKVFLARHDADAAPKAEIANKAETDFAPRLMRLRQVKARAPVTPENIQALCVFASWNSFYKCETHPWEIGRAHV